MSVGLVRWSHRVQRLITVSQLPFEPLECLGGSQTDSAGFGVRDLGDGWPEAPADTCRVCRRIAGGEISRGDAFDGNSALEALDDTGGCVGGGMEGFSVGHVSSSCAYCEAALPAETFGLSPEGRSLS
jgi:hypothetical protein